MAVPVVKFLEHCEPPTLVKINVENVARFAFLAKRGNAMIPAYVLLEDRCEVFNLAGSVGFLPHYESVAALDFGNDFVVQPSYTAACEIDQGGLFRTPGAIVRTSDADYLVASASGWRDLFYCNIKTGVRGGEPGRARVAFASWSLYASGDDEAALIACNVKSN